MVLNCVVSSTFQDLRDFSPFVAQSAMVKVEYPLLIRAPRDLLDLGIQMIVPPLSALLANSPWQMFRNLSPLLRAIGLNQVKHQSVLLLSPRSLH